MRYLLVVCSIVCIVLILSVGGLLFTLYSSYTPLRTASIFQMNNSVSTVAWSPDSQDFAAVTFGQNYGTSRAMMNLWRTRNAQKLLTYTFPAPPRGNAQLAWALDGRSFAIAWSDGSVEIWGAKAGSDSSSWSQKVSFHIGGHQDSQSPSITGLAWSAAGNHLLLSDLNGSLSVLSALNGHLLSLVQAPQVAYEKSSILALSANGTQAIISSRQTQNNVQTFAIWDIATSKESPLLSPNVMQADSATSAAWSPDEHAIAVGNGGKVTIWQWNEPSHNWTFLRSVTAATFYRVVSQLAWSPHGKRLATVDTANVTRLWNAENGNLLGPQFPLFDHPNSKLEEYTDTDNAITALAWSPNGKYLLSGNSPGQVMLQDVL